MKISIQKYYEIMAPSTPKISLISFIFPNDIAKFQRLHSPYEQCWRLQKLVSYSKILWIIMYLRLYFFKGMFMQVKHIPNTFEGYTSASFVNRSAVSMISFRVSEDRVST